MAEVVPAVVVNVVPAAGTTELSDIPYPEGVSWVEKYGGPGPNRWCCPSNNPDHITSCVDIHYVRAWNCSPSNANLCVIPCCILFLMESVLANYASVERDLEARIATYHGKVLPSNPSCTEWCTLFEIGLLCGPFNYKSSQLYTALKNFQRLRGNNPKPLQQTGAPPEAMMMKR